jgi:sarcosine oxidase subunit beta
MPTMPMPTAVDGAMGIVAMYDVSDDWLPVYDKSALQGYYMAIGTSGNQFKCNGPAGQLMAALIEYCENGHDHDAQPLQHLLPLSGETIDTSFFSRLRTQSSETSGTVMG